VEKISVVIPVFNGSKFIYDCLKSIFNSTYRNLEVVLVDDGSTDDLENVIDEFRPNIDLISTKFRRTAAARNFGFQRSSGELIAFLNADDINGRMRLELSVKRFENNPRVGMVFCGTTFINEYNEFLTGVSRFPNFTQDQFIGRMFEHKWINTISSTVIRSNIFKKIGEFDESFSLAEDYDLYLRIGMITKVDYIDLPLVRYRLHPDNQNKNWKEYRKYEIKALEKHDPVEIAASLSSLYEKEEDFRISFGKILFKIGLKEKALQQFHRALELNDKNDDGYFFIGNCYFDLGDIKQAYDAFTNCLKLNSKHAGCRNNMGIIYFHQGKYNRSAEEFRKAAEFGIDQIEPYYNLSCLEKADSSDALKMSIQDHVSMRYIHKQLHLRNEMIPDISL